MASDNRFPELVSIACHDLRTPLATVYGFSRTLGRLELEGPASRYVEMIDAASDQLGELLDQLSLVTRIESGRFEPSFAEVDSLELARAAASELGEERVLVSGEGAPVRVELEATRRALGQLARAAARHGGHDTVTLVVRGPELDLSPLSRSAAPVLLGEELRELGAAAAGILIRALGGSLAADGERLLIRLPA
ncbi:MAG TPA: histidine kinase dimerization/phospho-acceptor domain-containing protein [Gaiellaceae bacterium]|jgi:signal transduction histidine kinase|nr:histidine kinase dimerization/phospho-acceptor domain-containing protein [Gaiellaceae bacterium]